jgi:Protein of unknown function (DUF3341)
MKTTGMKLYAVGAEFPSATAVYEAAQKVRDRGFRWWDVHTPFPVHGMDAAMGMGKSWVSAISLAGAAFGLTLAFLLQTIPGVLIYPMIVQGKPFFTLPAFVPIMFEWTVLWCAFATVFGLLAFCFLPRLNHPVFNWERFDKASDDGFFIVIEAADPRFSATETPEFLKSLGGENVTLIHD